VRLYKVRMGRAGVVAEFAYECYDEGEPKEGDCVVVESDEALREWAPLGSDPQDAYPRLQRAGWRQPEP